MSIENQDQVMDHQAENEPSAQVKNPNKDDDRRLFQVKPSIRDWNPKIKIMSRLQRRIFGNFWKYGNQYL